MSHKVSRDSLCSSTILYTSFSLVRVRTFVIILTLVSSAQADRLRNIAHFSNCPTIQVLSDTQGAKATGCDRQLATVGEVSGDTLDNWRLATFGDHEFWVPLRKSCWYWKH